MGRYEDYICHTSEKIKATGEIKIENENSFLQSLGYPDEPKMNSKTKYVIDKSGMTINDKKL